MSRPLSTSSTNASPKSPAQPQAGAGSSPAPAPPPSLLNEEEILAKESNTSVFLCQDGTAEVTCILDPMVLRRIKNRAGNQNLADHIWLNILNRAFQTYVY